MKYCRGSIPPSVGLKSRSAVSLLYHSAHPECCYQFKIFTVTVKRLFPSCPRESWLLSRIFPTIIPSTSVFLKQILEDAVVCKIKYVALDALRILGVCILFETMGRCCC